MEKNSEGKFVFKPKFSKDLKVAACNAIVLSRAKKQDIVLDYNGIQIDVTPKMGIQHIMNAFFSLSKNAVFPEQQNTK